MGRGSKQAVTTIEAISEHLCGITALPSNGSGDFTGQRKELNVSSTHPVAQLWSGTL
ncbi:hypothetical protein K439DRAFT_1641495, partial [Ramaria rubella]